MPCYDPPYENTSDQIEVSVEARIRVRKYVQQLADIEAYLKLMMKVEADPPLPIEARQLAKEVIRMIHDPWETKP